jgi:hypothetical protein
MSRLVLAALVIPAFASAQLSGEEKERHRRALVTEAAGATLGSLVGVGVGATYILATNGMDKLQVDSRERDVPRGVAIGATGLVATMLGATRPAHRCAEHSRAPFAQGCGDRAAIGTVFATMIFLGARIQWAADIIPFVIFSLSQGTFTAWGSRAYARR